MLELAKQNCSDPYTNPNIAVRDVCSMRVFVKVIVLKQGIYYTQIQ